MTSTPRQTALGAYARAGFQQLSRSRELLLQLSEQVQTPSSMLLSAFSHAADPDAALTRALEIGERHPNVLIGLDETCWMKLALLFGASPALGEFFCRHPSRLRQIIEGDGRLIGAKQAKKRLLDAVQDEAVRDAAVREVESGSTALRISYRELLAEVVLFDLLGSQAGRGLSEIEEIMRSLTNLADAALEAGLVVGKNALIAGVSGLPVSSAKLDKLSLAIVAMGKCGARELNVVSDVDVLFITATPSTEAQSDENLRIATRLASEVMRAIHAPGIEPALWEVDANLRPEGKHGPLVRSLGSMITYYERWAKTWEFQALLKARAAAGDLALGERFVEQTREMVWESSSREDFVGTVQRMREQVIEQVDIDDLTAQLKLGPGGLRDIEFSVQLLQLVHGQNDATLHEAATLPALRALVSGGYVAREDGERLAEGYRLLRLLEHRLQLRDLRRTAIMPDESDDLRVLARAFHAVATGEELHKLWRRTRDEVRELHLKIFYAPLLNAVAELPESGIALDSVAARARLHSLGFRDPDGAMRHLASLTTGHSRAAKIQRNLLPVLLQWFSNGRDADFGLLAFRRVSEANRDTPWYLRLLRDGIDAAERLAFVLSHSKFAADMLESVPEAVAWLEHDEKLQPVPLTTLLDEMRALASRRETVDQVATALRAVHRREVLRMALGQLTSVINDRQVSEGLNAAHTALLDALLFSIQESESRVIRIERPYLDSGQLPVLSLIAMGRYGGGELGFASDIDLLGVYRALRDDGVPTEQSVENELSNRVDARRRAEHLVSELRRLVADPRFYVDLDFDLRPEGKNGPFVRTLEAYRAYYARWSLTWEAQALLRARAVAGDEQLARDFIELIDEIRYPKQFGEKEIREIRRMKARVEAERLPRGTDPRRHLKLGPGGLSDVEWLVQLIQLRFSAECPELRTTSTVAALDAATKFGVLDASDRVLLESSWLLASRIRSAAKLWSGKTTDVLPLDRTELEGITGVLGMPLGQTTQLEERWFAASRRARAVFEREFFGYDEGTPHLPV